MENTLTLKEFSRYFSKHKGKVTTVTSYGQVIGTWTPSDHKRSDLAKSDPKKRSDVDKGSDQKVKVAELQALADNTGEKFKSDFIKCTICRGGRAERRMWLNSRGSEESVCFKCAKKNVSPMVFETTWAAAESL